MYFIFSLSFFDVYHFVTYSGSSVLFLHHDCDNLMSKISSSFDFQSNDIFFSFLSKYLLLKRMFFFIFVQNKHFFLFISCLISIFTLFSIIFKHRFCVIFQIRLIFLSFFIHSYAQSLGIRSERVYLMNSKMDSNLIIINLYFQSEMIFQVCLMILLFLMQ
jgi:hypothetical protein